MLFLSSLKCSIKKVCFKCNYKSDSCPFKPLLLLSNAFSSQDYSPPGGLNHISFLNEYKGCSSKVRHFDKNKIFTLFDLFQQTHKKLRFSTEVINKVEVPRSKFGLLINQSVLFFCILK